jgi:hypothetical protein
MKIRSKRAQMNLKEWRKRLFRFSLFEPPFEGIQQSRIRGLCEHGVKNRAVWRVADGDEAGDG